MAALLTRYALADPGGIALRDDDTEIGWLQLSGRVNRWIALFRSRGIEAGDRVACLLGNRRETFEALLAGLHCGVVVVPVNWHLTAVEVAHIVSDSGSRGLLVEPAHAAAAAAALVRAGPGCPVRLVLGHRDVAGFDAVEPLLAAADDAEPAGQTSGSTLLYTSGTTGSPKGVENDLFLNGSSLDRVDRLIRYARSVLDVPAGERILLVGPWYHSAQLFFALLGLLQGCRLVIRRRFDAAGTLADIDAEQITGVHLVPTQLVRLLRLDGPTRDEFSGASLGRVWHGGAACPVAVKRQMIDWWGPVFLEYYGATEGGVVSMIGSADWLRRPGSVGRAVASGEILVVDPAGVPLPAGRVGRIFVRRRAGRTFRYHNDDGKTRSAHLTPDSFTYGEQGYVDDEGFLYLTGRGNDMIITGGVNVYPAEVEAVLLAHPAVHDAAVIGIADPEFGERVVALVELDAGRPHSAAELDRHCRQSLAGFKVPRTFRTVAALPREATGKLRGRALRESWLAGDDLDHTAGGRR